MGFLDKLSGLFGGSRQYSVRTKSGSEYVVEQIENNWFLTKDEKKCQIGMVGGKLAAQAKITDFEGYVIHYTEDGKRKSTTQVVEVRAL